MNKLMGFFELQFLDIPSIDWKEYVAGLSLDHQSLWTVRSALYTGEDHHLPRLVGKYGEEATSFAQNLLEEMKDKGMVIYYPFFEAVKSGNLQITLENIIIEGVEGDLWNMVTYFRKDTTMISEGDRIFCLQGREDFFSTNEIEKILSFVPYLRKEFQDIFFEGNHLLLEFSFAKYPKKEEEFLIFYELRSI